MRTMTKTNTLTAALALSALLLLPVLAGATTFSVDTAHSSVGFSVRHFFTPVGGEFGDFTGTVHYDPQNVSASSVEMTVQAASIDTNNADRDEHLRSADFFEVEKYPTLSFKSSAVKAMGEGKLEVTGEFTLHGVTKQITVPVNVLGVMTMPDGSKIAGFETSFEIDRKDYGITWNRVLDQGGAVLGDTVQVRINIEARGQAEESEEQASR